MATLADLENVVLQNLEEDPASPQFWSLPDEILVFLVEAMNEAVIITGEPELRSATLSVLATQTIQNLPAGHLCLLRMEVAGVHIPKMRVDKLDKTNPAWQAEAAAATLKGWFPFGLGKFGVYPQLTGGVTATVSYVGIPTTASRPYANTITVPFQQEFHDAFIHYASGIARLKEGGMEFIQGVLKMDHFLDKMFEMSKFSYRKDSLRFSAALGAAARISDVEKR